MSTTEQILGEFIDAWNAGRRPRVRDYLARVSDATQRDELADQLSVWLEVAPTPGFDAATRAEIRAEPVVRDVLRGSSLLVTLRERRGWSVPQLAERLVARFGLTREDTGRAAGYVTQLERGELDPARLSRRLLDALAELLEAGPGTLFDVSANVRRGAAGAALMRTEARPDAQFLSDLELLSEAALRPAEPSLDPLDRLFLGGPQG